MDSLASDMEQSSAIRKRTSTLKGRSMETGRKVKETYNIANWFNS